MPSIVNMYFIPAGMLVKQLPGVRAAAGLDNALFNQLTWASMWQGNLISVTLDYLVGGGLLVALCT